MWWCCRAQRTPAACSGPARSPRSPAWRSTRSSASACPTMHCGRKRCVWTSAAPAARGGRAAWWVLTTASSSDHFLFRPGHFLLGSDHFLLCSDHFLLCSDHFLFCSNFLPSTTRCRCQQLFLMSSQTQPSLFILFHLPPPLQSSSHLLLSSAPSLSPRLPCAFLRSSHHLITPPPLSSCRRGPR